MLPAFWSLKLRCLGVAARLRQPSLPLLLVLRGCWSRKGSLSALLLLLLRLQAGFLCLASLSCRCLHHHCRRRQTSGSPCEQQ